MFEKGQMYMLRGMKKNKRYNTLTDMDGTLYVADSQGWHSQACPNFTDGALFLCLEDSPEFDCDAFEKTLDASAGEYHRMGAIGRARASYEYHREVSFLTPNGNRVRMRVKGNKTKFKKVTSRTRVKR